MKEVTKGAYITCVVFLIFTLLAWSMLGNMTCLAIGGVVAKNEIEDGIENSEDVAESIWDTGFNTILSYIICHIFSFLLWLTSIIICSVYIHKYRTQIKSA
tara:strand:+ start:270 stop:572 length:303 start_codon:yes stop_codon:yes gene_type:complete